MIRSVTIDDAPAIQAIYAPIVEATPISFELVPPTVEEMRARIVSTTAKLPWLVDEEEGVVTGYAYASPHRARPAYQWCVEVSVYVGSERRRSGVGRRLYAQLFAELAELGYMNAYAGVAIPNDASVRLHEAVGFEPIGVFPRTGFKLGAWHDVAWFGRTLRPHDPTPMAPRRAGRVAPSVPDEWT